MKKNKFAIIVGLTGLVLLQSCAIHKNKEADLSLDQLDTTYFDPENTTQKEPIAYDAYFKDAQLKHLIQRVLTNNNDLIIAVENLKANEALLKSTKLNYLPNVNLQVTPSIQRLSKNSMIGDFANNLTYEDYTVAANLSWELDLWGKLKNERAEALNLYLAQAETIRAIQIQLITQTATSYYNLSFLNMQLQEVEKLKAFAEQSVKIMEHQYAYGDASSIAIKQAKDQAFELDRLVVEINQNIKSQEIVLSTLLGQFPEKFSYAIDITNVNFGYTTNSKIAVQQLQNRPDVKRAELELKAANARVGINKAALYPAITISAQGGFNSLNTSNLFNIPASLFGNLAGSLTQPLFNKRQLKSNFKQAEHIREAKIAAFKQELVKATAEVTEALNNLDSFNKQKTIVSHKLNNLEHGITDAQKLYQYGEITYLEVLAMQQIYIQVNMAHLEINFSNINANILLFKAIGG